MKRPLAVLTLVFCLGIFVADRIKLSFLWVYCFSWILFVFCLFSFRKKLTFDLILFFLAFCLGVTSLKDSLTLPQSHVSKLSHYKDSNFYAVRGSIISQPEHKNNRGSFLFAVKEIKAANFRQNSCGNILVYFKGRNNFRCQEELILEGSLSRPYSNKASGKNNYSGYLSRRGVLSIMRLRSSRRLGDSNNSFGLKRFALYLKEKIEKVFFLRLSPLAAGILDAMVLGEKNNIPPLVYNSMIKSGTVHILVVSGFNVGIVSFIIILFLRLLRISRNARFYITVPLLLIYCFMTGASTPVVRATVMSIFFLLGFLLKREPDIYNSLSLAAIFILAIDPRQLSDLGFKLSFASVISIVYFYPKIKSLLAVKNLKTTHLRFLVDGFLVSFSAWLGTLGLIAYYFKLFSPVTVLANLFIVPLATLITLCGFSLTAAEFVLPPLALPFAESCQFLIMLLLKINGFLINIPGAYLYLFGRT
jgi:competence protein ComEC